MKISLFSRECKWEEQQLLQVAEQHGVEVSHHAISTVSELSDRISAIGNIAYWRSGHITREERVSVLKKIVDSNRSGVHVVNSGNIRNSEIVIKSIQQNIVETANLCDGIDTYTYISKADFLENRNSSHLEYPFIVKPDYGSRGEGVFLAKSDEDIPDDLDWSNTIFQPYIKNSGDYRAFVVGGKVLGIMKRVGEDGSVTNNISQGGKGYVVTDEDAYERISTIATRIAGLFELQVVGVDVIYDEEDHIYRFLELNTVPQWQGFQNSTGIVVAEELLHLFSAFSDRKEKKHTNLVREYFDTNMHGLSREKRFHYAYRMYMKTGDEQYLEVLDSLRSWNLPQTSEERKNYFQKVLSDTDSIVRHQELRKDALSKYSFVVPVMSAILRVLYEDTLYQNDTRLELRESIDQMIGIDVLAQKSTALLNDTESLFALSTYGINVLYLLEYLFENDDRFTVDRRTLISQWLETEKVYSEHDNEAWAYLSGYYLTHCIIGETLFYRKEIDAEIKALYSEAVQRIDVILQEQFELFSLDIKCEVLLCAQMLGYELNSSEQILEECEKSLSPIGNFIIDRYNKNSERKLYDFWTAEHRNILYIMSTLK